MSVIPMHQKSFRKGAKALQVLVPVETTLLKDGDHYVRYSDASKELQEAYKNNQIDSLIRKSYKIGNVFDISQTDFPKEKYPEYFSMGYPSELHAQILKGLQDYSLNTLHSPERVCILYHNLHIGKKVIFLLLQIRVGTLTSVNSKPFYLLKSICLSADQPEKNFSG